MCLGVGLSIWVRVVAVMDVSVDILVGVSIRVDVVCGRCECV